MVRGSAADGVGARSADAAAGSWHAGADAAQAGGGTSAWKLPVERDRGAARPSDLEDMEGRLSRLERAAARAQERLLDAEHSIQGLLGGRSAVRLAEDIAEMQRMVQERSSGNRQLAALEASLSEVRATMEAKISDMLSGLILGTQRIRQVESTISTLEGNQERVAELVQDFKQLKFDAEGHRQRLAACEKAAEDIMLARWRPAEEETVRRRFVSPGSVRRRQEVQRKGSADASELRAALAAAQREVSELHQRGEGQKTGEAQREQLAALSTGLEVLAGRVADIDRKMGSLVNASLHDVQQSTEGLSSVSARLDELSQRIGGLPKPEEFDELTTIVSHMHKQANRCEGAIQGLAAAAQVQELREAMMAVQAKLGLETSLGQADDSFEDGGGVALLAGKLEALERSLAAVAQQAERIEPAIGCIEQLADQIGEVRALATGAQAPVAGGGDGLMSAPHGVEKRMATCEQESRGVKATMQKLQVVQDRVMSQLKKLERDGADEAIPQLREAIMALQARVAGVEAGAAGAGAYQPSAMSDAIVLADTRAQLNQEVRYATSGLHSDIMTLRQALDGKVSAKDVQKFQSALEGLHERLGRAELSLESKPDAKGVQQLGGELSAIQLKLGDIDMALRQKPDNKELKLLSEEVAGLRGLTTDDSNNIEGIMRQMRGIENDIQACCSQQQQSKRAFADLETKISGFGMYLQDKADIAQFKTLNSTIVAMQSQLKACEKEVHDKASQWHGQLQQVAGNVNTMSNKVSAVEASVSDKASSSQLMQMKRAMAEMEARFDGVEMSVKDKADIAHFMDVSGKLAPLQAQLTACDQELHQKVDLGQYKSLHSTLLSVQTSLTTCEHELHEKASNEQFQQVKSTVTSVRSQLSNAELELHGKAGAEQLQLLRVNMSSFEARLTACSQQQQQQQHQLRMMQEATASLRKHSMLALEDGGGLDR